MKRTFTTINPGRSVCDFVKPDGEAIRLGYSCAPLRLVESEDRDAGLARVITLQDISRVEQVTRLNLFVNRLMAIMNPIMMAISSGLSLAIYWIGAYIINDASLAERLPLFSDMVVFMSYAMQVVMGFLLMGALFIVLPVRTQEGRSASSGR